MNQVIDNKLKKKISTTKQFSLRASTREIVVDNYVYYISEIVRALWLVNVQYGPWHLKLQSISINFNFCIKITYLKRLHSDKELEKQKRSEEGLPNFRRDLSEVLEPENVQDVDQPEPAKLESGT